MLLVPRVFMMLESFRMLPAFVMHVTQPAPHAA